ncbi:RNA polymerase sigma factor [Mucilaginibacter sp.]|uniref:RNA polymerase sigma factor n=1 Tax=Mucilaginibacter sp. TaxID=1882438 RepID=UPI0026042F65|nr:RNA polymerase sigma-70 factor [Mucilaginibacter sp.]MDB4927308.1 polymerase sigma factor, sigma-70 family [Mucilaginibacter sp.]
MDDLNEKFLLTQISIGDDAAFSEIYAAYQPLLYRFVNRFLKSTAISEEICQDVFIKLWEKRQNLLYIESLKSYLFTLAKNQAFNLLKRSSLDNNIKAEILYSYIPEENTIEDKLHADEYMQYIEKVLNTLPLQSREVFRLCRQLGKTYDEAANDLGISRNGIKKHMVRSMKVLKYNVQRDFGIPLSIILAIIFNS